MPAHPSTQTLRSVRDLTDEELGELLASQGRVIEVEEKLGLRYPTATRATTTTSSLSRATVTTMSKLRHTMPIAIAATLGALIGVFADQSIDGKVVLGS